ncbi:hypothetical protein [Streptomyces sp. NPDC001568]|uniref:hypothetical protein n=1 Tax=Streptomyces sp. NPDC001568 TaxID=3364588 RepID=UPI0036C237B3
MRINRSTFARTASAALSGLLSGYAALAVAEPVSAAVRPEAGPVTAVGGAAIDRTATVKDWAIRQFGTADRPVLQLGILATLGLLAVAPGLPALRRRRTGAAGVLLFGLVCGAAALTRPDSTGPFDALPSLVGALGGAGLLYFLIGRPTVVRQESAGADGWSRHGFLVAAGAAAPASTAAGALGRQPNSSRVRGAEASRAAVGLPAPALPAPASPATPLPRGPSLRVPGITRFTTPDADFHRATDGTCALRTEQRARTIPDGARGWHSAVVGVA